MFLFTGTDSYVTETPSEDYTTEYEDTAVRRLTTLSPKQQVTIASQITTMTRLPFPEITLPTSTAPTTFSLTTAEKLTSRILFTTRPNLITSMKPETSSPKPTLTTIASLPIVPTKTTTLYFVNDMLTLPIATTTIEKLESIATEAPIVVQKEYPSDTDGANHPVLSDKTAPIQEKPAPSNKGTVIAILTLCLIVVGVLGLIFLAKRYTSRNWMSVRRMRSGNGDSQSDVRFLTNDEILDFRLQLPQSEY